MTKCTAPFIEFPALKRRKVEVNFEGGEITSDGGALLIGGVDQKLGLTKAIAPLIPDNRDPSKTEHSILSMLRQRVYGIALGHEDLNDHKHLRNDTALQTALGQTKPLASPSTLCRFENSVERQIAFEIHEVIVEQFISSFKKPPKQLILDFDATDDLVHGEQEGRFFHGYYRDYCFLPLQVFCGKQLLVSYLRSSMNDGAKHTWAILSLLVKRFRAVWPGVEIVFRGDSGFCRHKMMTWCDRNEVKYIIGLPGNAVVKGELKPTMEKAKEEFTKTMEKQKLFTQFKYAAKSWKYERKVIGKAEYTAQGENSRFVVTNLEGDAQELYDSLYCARGDMENQIKQLKLELFSDRTSCHLWWANQLRLLLSSLAYILVERFRALGLKGTSLAKAQIHTIRLKLFKVGGIVLRNTRRIRFLLSSSYPYQDLFTKAAERLCC
jgi:hypothetical protein